MARSRNIKPGFFKNEDLAECSLTARLCFAGLWTQADREGRLEDRPKRIKGELFPFDSIEVEPLLVELERWKFIRRYIVCEERFIQIVNFVKHQVPHGTEKDSLIPDESGLRTIHERGNSGYTTGKVRLEEGAATVKQGSATQADNGALTVQDGRSEGGQKPLIPDSRFPIPDSLIPEHDSVPNGTGVAAMPSTKDELWKAGKSLLSQSGMPQAQCGSFIGKLTKDYGDEAVLAAVRAAVVERPADPAAWLKALCARTGGQRNGRPSAHRGISQRNYEEGFDAVTH